MISIAGGDRGGELLARWRRPPRRRRARPGRPTPTGAAPTAGACRRSRARGRASRSSARRSAPAPSRRGRGPSAGACPPQPATRRCTISAGPVRQRRHRDAEGVEQALAARRPAGPGRRSARKAAAKAARRATAVAPSVLGATAVTELGSSWWVRGDGAVLRCDVVRVRRDAAPAGAAASRCAPTMRSGAATNVNRSGARAREPLEREHLDDLDAVLDEQDPVDGQARVAVAGRDVLERGGVGADHDAALGGQPLAGALVRARGRRRRGRGRPRVVPQLRPAGAHQITASPGSIARSPAAAARSSAVIAVRRREPLDAEGGGDVEQHAGGDDRGDRVHAVLDEAAALLGGSRRRCRRAAARRG